MKRTYRNLKERVTGLVVSGVAITVHSENDKIVFEPKDQSKAFAWGLSVSEAHTWLDGFERPALLLARVAARLHGIDESDLTTAERSILGITRSLISGGCFGDL